MQQKVNNAIFYCCPDQSIYTDWFTLKSRKERANNEFRDTGEPVATL